MNLMPLAKHCSSVSSFLVMDILARAQEMQRSGIDIIHLEIGEPDFDTPLAIMQEGQKALDCGECHYTASQGNIALREAISLHYKKKYNVAIDADQVIVFPGTSPAMQLIFSALLDEDDEVVISNPSYACYKNFVSYAKAKVREVLTYEEDGFQYCAHSLAKALNNKTKAIVINSPTNPTGIVMTEDKVKELVKVRDDFAKEQGRIPLILSDEIYHGLTYEGKEHSVLEYTKHAIVFNGFSKAYAMTGWRLGYAIVPKEYVKPLIALMQNFYLSVNSMAQCAGIYALNNADDEVASMRAIYNERRLYVLKALKELGFEIPVEPKGAFYVLINARHLAKTFDGSCVKLAYDILEKAHIGITPGSEFGSQAKGFLRISYANSMENLQEAMRRLAKYIEEF